MIMHKALHPRDDVDRLYVSGKEGGRGFASKEDSVDTSIQRLEDYIQSESLRIAAKNNAIRTLHTKARIDKTQQNKRMWQISAEGI